MTLKKSAQKPTPVHVSPGVLLQQALGSAAPEYDADRIYDIERMFTLAPSDPIERAIQRCHSVAIYLSDPNFYISDDTRVKMAHALFAIASGAPADEALGVKRSAGSKKTLKREIEDLRIAFAVQQMLDQQLELKAACQQLERDMTHKLAAELEGTLLGALRPISADSIERVYYVWRAHIESCRRSSTNRAI